MEKAKKMSKNCYELVSGKLQEQHILMLHLQCSAEVWNQWGHLSHQPKFSGDIFKISETMAFFHILPLHCMSLLSAWLESVVVLKLLFLPVKLLCLLCLIQSLQLVTFSKRSYLTTIFAGTCAQVSKPFPMLYSVELVLAGSDDVGALLVTVSGFGDQVT